jgi:hypothetical protein
MAWRNNRPSLWRRTWPVRLSFTSPIIFILVLLHSLILHVSYARNPSNICNSTCNNTCTCTHSHSTKFADLTYETQDTGYYCAVHPRTSSCNVLSTTGRSLGADSLLSPRQGVLAWRSLLSITRVVIMGTGWKFSNIRMNDGWMDGCA